MGMAVQEALWVRQMTDELGITEVGEPTPIWCDNQSAIKLASVGILRPKTRHITIRYHLLREHVQEGNVVVDFVRTDENLADYLTKDVSVAKLDFCNRGVGMLM